MSCGRYVVSACRDAGFEPDVVHQLDDFPTALHLIAAGQGISLIPDLGLTHVPDGVRILDLDPPLSRTIQLAYRAASAERPAVVAVRDALGVVAKSLELVPAAA
jgi:DNA-binding transcriptional LysR family regulator